MDKRQNIIAAIAMISDTRPSCIFCGNTLDGSDEHIIPASVNGRLHTKELICAACNQKFGSKLDPIVKETLYFVLFALGMGNAKKITVTDQDGKAYTVDQTGKMKEVAPVVEVIRDGEKIGVSVNGEKTEAIRAFAKKLTRTFGMKALKLLEDKEAFQLEEKINFLTEVKSSLAIEITPKLKLAVNKVITEFYAYSGLPLGFISERLERIYCLDEGGNDITICNFDKAVRQTAENEVSHLLVIRSNHEKKLLYGYVEILNVICGYTIFTHNYEGPDVDFVYHQNVITSEKMNGDIVINTDAVTGHGENFEVLVNTVLENVRSIEQIARFNMALDQLKEQLDKDVVAGKIPEDERDKQFIKTAVDLAAHIMVFENPDDVIDFTKEEEIMVNYIHSVIKESGKAEFEFFYHQLVGRDFPSEDDGLIYVMEAFKYQKRAPKNGESRLKAFCYFKAKDASNEKYFPVKEIFDVLKLPLPPLDMIWL